MPSFTEFYHSAGKPRKKSGFADFYEGAGKKVADKTKDIASEGLEEVVESGGTPALAQAGKTLSKPEIIQQQREKAGEFFEGNAFTEGLRDYVLEPAANFLDKLRFNNPAGRFVDRASQSGTEMLGQPRLANPVSTGSKTADVIADLTGQAAGIAVAPGPPGGSLVKAAYKNPFTQKVAGAVGSRFSNPTAQKIAQEVTREGIAGAAIEGALPLMRGENDPKEILKSSLIGGTIGASMGGLGSAIAPGVKTALQRLRGRQGASPEAIDEILALPEPRQRGRQNTAQTPDVIEVPETGPRALPEPNLLPPTRARREVKVNPAREKWNQLVGVANSTKFTPGRELEELEDIWSRMAGAEDPGLMDLIDQAFPKQRQVPGDALQRARTSQQGREVAGVQGPVRSFADRYQSFTGAAAPPIERVGRQQATKRSQPEPVERIRPEEPITARNEVESPEVQRHFDDLNLDPEIRQADQTNIPRVRDRLNAVADEWIQQAKNDMKRISSNPLDIYAKLGAGYMLKGTVKLADFTEAMVRELGEGIRPRIREIFQRSKQQYEQIRKQAEQESLGVNDIDVMKLKDFSGFKFNTSDVYRNFRDVFGEQYPKIKKAILDPLDEAKRENINFQEKYLNGMDHIVNNLGIKRNSRLSALVQDFGEGKISLEQLKDTTPKWEAVVEADKWFRKAYDELLDRVNQVRSQIYPTNPDKLVPKRSDYYRHFQELNGLEGLKNMFETPSNIDPRLEGISEFTQPRSKFAGFMQKRGLGPYKKDAVGGFLNYLPAASHAIHIDPHITPFQKLARNLAEMTVQTKNINNFIRYLQRYSQDLAGKTGQIDRLIVDNIPGSRKTLGVLNWFNNRAKSNTIVGNVGTVLAQGANIPNGVAFAKQYSIPGAGRTLNSIFTPNEAMKKSGFIKERFAQKMYRKFDTDWLSFRNPLHLRRMAEWMLESGDRMGTEFIWYSVYEKALREGVENPVKYADDHTRRLVAGRGVGEVPLLQKNKSIQLVMPFTLEVANLWRVMKDFVKAKDFAGLALLFVGSYLFNRVSEQTRGSEVTFDPINAMIEAANSGDIKKAVGRLSGEVLSNLPLGQSVASLYPQYGGDVLGVELPTREEFFGDADPTRYGSGLLLARAAQDPLRYLVPGFGGNQLKKTIEGTKALAEEGSFQDGKKLRFPIDRSPENLLRAPLFGQYATSEAKEYFKKERRPLSEKQTDAYLQSSNPQQFYDQLMRTRRIDSYQREINDITKDQNLSPEAKRKEVDKVLKEFNQFLNQ